MNLAEAMNPPLLTADLAGIGGRIKQEPEDFDVEEIPAYEPSGQGDHLYLWIEKRGMGAEFFVRQIAKRLGIAPGEVGTAGLKDRHAVTRQYVSVPAECEPRLADIEGEGVRFLKSTRHGNKLKPGHLRGNRFRILIRDADPSKLSDLNACLERLRQHGLPNYYGPQRFGRDGETALLGQKLLRREGGFVRQGFLRKLALSAAQSALFNNYLTARMRDGLLRTVLAGDAMMKWPAGGLFTAEDVAIEQGRFESREIVPGGPMFGTKMFPVKAVAAEREAAILSSAGLDERSFGGFGKLMSGTRRYTLVYVDDVTAEWGPAGLRLAFSLPAGCYATVLLREIMKGEVVAEENSAE